MSSLHKNITYLELLPDDILYIELARHISKADLFCVELAIGRKKLPDKQHFPADIHEQIVQEGLHRYQYFDKYKVFDNSESMNLAAKYGQVEIIQYGIDNEFMFMDQALNNAAEYGHLECIELLLAKTKLYFNDNTLMFAVKGGNLDCINYIIKQRKRGFSKAIPIAAYYGHLEIFKKLIRFTKGVSMLHYIHDAIAGGHIHIIEYILTTERRRRRIGQIDASQFHHKAIVHKQYHVLTYFLQNYISSNSGYHTAIWQRDITALQCLFDNGVFIDNTSRTLALDVGNQEIIEWFTAH